MIGKHGAICDCELVDRGDVNKRISPDFLWNTFFKSFGKLFLNIIQWLKLISFSNVCSVLQVNIFNNILVCCLIVGSVSFPFLVTPGFPDGTVVKNLPAMQEMWVQSLGQEDPLEEEMATTPVFLPGKSHEQGSLAGYSPWGHKKSDTTEWLRAQCVAQSLTCNRRFTSVN